MSEWTKNLNPEQKDACLHNEGPMLILAGAGAGKTTTLVNRAGRLIDEKIVKAPENICVLTFTNKAARELKHRVSEKIEAAKKIWTGTFHSYGVRTLKKYHKELGLPAFFGILDQQDALALAKDILKDFKLYKKDSFDLELLFSIMSRWRESGQTESSTDNEYDIVSEWLLPKYEKRKSLLGVVDFDDLIIKVIDLYKTNSLALDKDQNQFQQIMVDEFQDTNISQMKLIELLSKKHCNISVVGDDDQSIYGWRGARVENILQFPKKFKNCKVVRLEKNYRSNPSIIHFANESIKKNQKRHPKTLIAEKKIEPKKPEIFVYENEDEELQGILFEVDNCIQQGYEYKDIAILFRSNSQGAFLEAELKSKKIPYKISGGMSFLERKEVKDVHSYLKCALKPNDIDFRRILNTPSRGIGEVSLEKIVTASKNLNMPFFQTIKKWGQFEIPAKTGNSIDLLISSLVQLQKSLLENRTLSCGAILKQFMEEIGYRKTVFDSSKDPEVGLKRWRLVEIYCDILDRNMENKKRDFASLFDFVSSLDLKDQEDEDKKNEVQLMTLHSCKGLEFPCVFLIGLEEDILPHRKLGQDINEERRLFYVGVTRAQDNLIITYCRQRKTNGRAQKRLPSRFIEEISNTLYVKYEQGARPISVDQKKKMLSDLINSL